MLQLTTLRSREFSRVTQQSASYWPIHFRFRHQANHIRKKNLTDFSRIELFHFMIVSLNLRALLSGFCRVKPLVCFAMPPIFLITFSIHSSCESDSPHSKSLLTSQVSAYRCLMNCISLCIRQCPLNLHLGIFVSAELASPRLCVR